MNFTSPSVNLLFRNNEVSFRQVLNGHPASLTRSISETVSRAISETIKATVAQFRSGGSRERARGAAFPPLFWVKKKIAEGRKLYYVVLLEFSRFTQQFATQFGSSCCSQEEQRQR